MITARKRCLHVFASAFFAVCGLVAIEQAPAHAVAQSAAPTLQPAVWQKGVQACLSNRTSESIKLLWGNEMYPADYVIRLSENVTRVGNGKVTLKPGMKICSTGRTNLPGTMDVTVSVTYENGREQQFGFYNPSMGRPDFYPLYQGSSVGKHTTFSVGDVHEYEYHFHTFTVSREADTKVKEFRVVFVQ